MATTTYLRPRTTGPGFIETRTVETSSGAADSGKIVNLDANGRIALGFMPAGIGADTVTATATEALAAGDFVNIHAGGVRKADNSNGREANGYVIAAVANAATATIYSDDVNTAVAGLTLGTAYYLGTGGAVTATAPTAPGTLVQFLGRATAATSLRTQIFPPIELA